MVERKAVRLGSFFFFLPLYDNVPDVVFWQTQAKEIEDMTGICIYDGTWSGAHALEVSDYAELISPAKGIELTEKELMTVARRGINF